MKDQHTTIAELKEKIAEFVSERQWQKHHRPKNLATSIVIEAAELLEHFQWEEVEGGQAVQENVERLHDIGEEIADVLAYLLSLSNALGLDVAEILEKKMQRNAEKYPVEDCLHGKYSKSTQAKK